MPSEPTKQDATAVEILATTCTPSLLILTRKEGPKGIPELNQPTPVYTFEEASELLARWADSAPDGPSYSGVCGWAAPHRVEVEVYFGAAVGTVLTDDVINLIVPLKRCHAESGYDLRLHLKRFAANLHRLADAAKGLGLKREG